MKQNKRSAAKNLLATVLMIGAVAGGFYGVTQSVVATENSKVVTLPTSYPAITKLSVTSDETAKLPVSNPSGAPVASDSAAKQSYTLVDNDLPYYQDRRPTANDISREEAAAIGVKGWEDAFGIDLAGKTVEMAYYPAENGYRAHWIAEYWYNGKKKPSDLYAGQYYFSVDSVTGELLTVQYTRVLDEDVDTGYDMALKESGGGKYRALAEKEALEHGAIQSAVKEIVSIGQGSSNNDPDIFFEMTGENGERAQIQLSRYDGALLAIAYDGMMREMEVTKRDLEEFNKRAEAYYAANPGATSYEE